MNPDSHPYTISVNEAYVNQKCKCIVNYKYFKEKGFVQ